MSAEPNDDPRPEERVGQVLAGKWTVDRLIEVGGMSTVYAATHRNGRHVAIKVLQRRYARDPEVRRRFLREGYVANKIDHPGALAILDDDTFQDGTPFLVMELLDGESLSARLTRAGGRLPVPEVLAIAEQLLEVLEVAHPCGIVHRDIKPGNVFVTNAGHTKLLDFGLARVRDGELSLIPTATGVVLGTAAYMAPEQARGVPEDVDARADLFAVGAVVFRALVGRPIHERATPLDTVVAAMRDRAPPLASVLAGAGPLLAAAMDRALAFDKEGRWPNASAMRRAVRAAYDEARVRPPPLPRIRPAAAAAPTAEDTLESSIPFDLIQAPSAVIEVAFGDQHDDALERERVRTREATAGLQEEEKPGAR